MYDSMAWLMSLSLPPARPAARPRHRDSSVTRNSLSASGLIVPTPAVYAASP